jgi:hypothetical protein
MNEEQDKQPLSSQPGDLANLELPIPELLLERVKTYCSKHEIDLHVFIIDAITEKLELSHKERRKKQRI